MDCRQKGGIPPILSPEQLFVHVVSEQFLTDMFLIRHTPLRGISLFLLSGEQEPFKESIRIRYWAQSGDILFAGDLKDFVDSFL